MHALEDRQTPYPATRERWEQIIHDARRVTGQWGEMVLAAGWSLAQVFGFDPESGEHGLVIALRGRRLLGINSQFATLPTGTGLEWFHPHVAEDAPLLWNFNPRKLVR